VIHRFYCSICSDKCW